MILQSIRIWNQQFENVRRWLRSIVVQYQVGCFQSTVEDLDTLIGAGAVQTSKRVYKVVIGL